MALIAMRSPIDGVVICPIIYHLCHFSIGLKPEDKIVVVNTIFGFGNQDQLSKGKEGTFKHPVIMLMLYSQPL